MSAVTVELIQPDAARFAPFGTFVEPPPMVGQRATFSEYLERHKAASTPALHVNHVMPSRLPVEVTQLERHPFAAQIFIPLAVSRYIALVMPSDEHGAPLPAKALGLLVPGNVGIIYHPGVWHAGAAVLDGPGHFAVLMWRGGPGDDDEFRVIPPLLLAAPASAGDAERAAE